MCIPSCWKWSASMALAAAAFAAPALAGPLAYSVERGNVHLVDLADHTYEVVVPTSIPQLHLEHLDLAEDGLLYGLGGETGLDLYRVDPATGAAALVASYSGSGAAGIASDGEGGAWIAVDVAPPFPSEFEMVLRHVDLATGAVLEEIPSGTLGTLFRLVGGGGELYALTGHQDSEELVAWLERIDPTTGVGTLLHVVPFYDGAPGLAPLLRGGDFDGNGGVWFAGAWGEVILGIEGYSYQRIDLHTGALQDVWFGNIFNPPHPPLTGFAIARQGSVAEIPALGPGGLAALAGLLGLAAVAVLRRRGGA